MIEQEQDAESVHDNLAFVRSLVSDGPRMQASSGLLFLIAGLVYGLDCLAYWVTFHVTMPPIMWLVLSIAPTVLFLITVVYVIWRDRGIRQQGVATRALNAAFGSAGLANLAMVVTFGYVAMTEKSMLIWLLYPAVMCAFQGAVWYVAFMIRRKAWLIGVSIGWFATTLALGYLIRDTADYLLVLGIALIVLMGGSGWTMMRLAKKAA